MILQEAQRIRSAEIDLHCVAVGENADLVRSTVITTFEVKLIIMHDIKFK